MRIKQLNKFLFKLDELLAKTYASFLSDRPSLVIILLHALFTSENEKKYGQIDPTQGITVEQLKSFIECFLDRKYTFIAPDDILNGLNPETKYAMITFDDGYYNNILSLPILKKYMVPATFFISTGHVLQQKCFWWDVVYRERKKQGITMKKIIEECDTLKLKKNNKIEQYICKNFGNSALLPKGEIDRPIDIKEFKSFAKNKYVTVGNHTNSHAILTNYSYKEIRQEIVTSQEVIFDITDVKPIVISYPNGNCSKEVFKVSQDAGLKLGITTIGNKNRLPLCLDNFEQFQLKRFTLSGQKSIGGQCKYFASDLQLGGIINNFIKTRTAT